MLLVLDFQFKENFLKVYLVYACLLIGAKIVLRLECFFFVHKKLWSMLEMQL